MKEYRIKEVRDEFYIQERRWFGWKTLEFYQMRKVPRKSFWEVYLTNMFSHKSDCLYFIKHLDNYPPIIKYKGHKIIPIHIIGDHYKYCLKRKLKWEYTHKRFKIDTYRCVRDGIVYCSPSFVLPDDELGLETSKQIIDKLEREKKERKEFNKTKYHKV